MLPGALSATCFVLYPETVTARNYATRTDENGRSERDRFPPQCPAGGGTDMATQTPTEITDRDARDLNDPLAGLIAEEVARHWYEIATSDPSKLQAKLAEQEEQLRSPGGVGHRPAA